MDLDRMIPILHAHFHDAHSLGKSRFAYLLDSGTKKVQAGFACSFRESPVRNARTLAPGTSP